jgi:hypothetical protein
VLTCCFGRQSYNRDFVAKFGDEEFDDFINYAVYFRGRDYDGGRIVFISSPNGAEGCKAPFIVTLNAKTAKVQSTSRHLLKDTCQIDESKMVRLVLKFTEYKVAFLKVDSNKNVYVNVTQAERPTLVRFSDFKYVTADYKKWKHIQGNWYESE